MLREFFTGVGLLFGGFRFWRVRPGLMVLGLLPALIAVALLAAAILPLAFNMTAIAEWATPFADGWDELWRTSLRLVVGAAIIVAALALASAVFTALTLTIGDPFYQRIWHAVETELGDPPPADGGGFWTSVGEGVRLVLLGIVIAVIVLVVGFLPLVGGIASAVLGVVLSGRLLARELTGRAFDARDLSSLDRAALFRGSRARVLGFGIATQLCFLIPGGAIAIMPSAVVGSTVLARTMQRRLAASHPPPQPPAPQPPAPQPPAPQPRVTQHPAPQPRAPQPPAPQPPAPQPPAPQPPAPRPPVPGRPD
ncbi:EI24 domain-containing protein [uncultured Microbacterium sp.]|uniref:EI24 domain-containing protein n=1 Tax=uncultured Microbacterium sp. TaxID=191216 RepID=UPI0028DB0FBB|nr:EI24 domain-containing protein [uncultured Microbacterium sp.]